jgi:hypothetical protein
MKSNKDFIIGIGKAIISRIGDICPDKILVNPAELESIINYQFNVFLNRHDNRIFFGLDTEYTEQNYLESLSLNIIKIVANLADEIKRHGDDISLLQIKKSLNQCLDNTNIPLWLSEKLIDHLPPLFIRELSTSLLKNDSQSKPEKYFIFLKGSKIIECDKFGLNKFYNKTDIRQYDIFIENTHNQRILIHNNPKIFRAGNYHEFSILNLLLQRLGKSVTYNEIYHLAVKPLEKARPKDRSKKVYDYIKRINNKITEARKPIKNTEEWFNRLPKKGMVQISDKINACLVVSIDNLVG